MIDRVKLTKGPNPEDIWVGMEGSLEAGQTPEQMLTEISERISEWKKWQLVNRDQGVDFGFSLPVIQIDNDETRDEVLKNLHKNKH